MDNMQRTAGIPANMKLDRGNAPVQPGLYIGEVRNVYDKQTRSGRVQVWIEDFGGPDKENPDNWKTVLPVSPFYGYTSPAAEQDTGDGNYILNKQSYGMWFTPPDIGTSVVCFFASSDSNYGYYLGAVVEAGINHMLPAIGASKNYKLDNSSQSSYFKNALQLPVVEINDNNQQIAENPRFFDQPKPVHSVVAATMLQQGLIKDPIRGPINSTAQRESPSAVYGISTPGRPIYLGGMSDENVRQKAESGQLTPQDAKVIARRGGHSFIMDDGDLSGSDQLVRIRTAKGHQITMSDSGDCFFITHANGQTWLEFGNQGTVDIYSTNSINLRSQGDINLHADRSINLNAKGAINMRGEQAFAVEGGLIQMNASKAMLLYSDKFVGIKSDGTVSLHGAKSGTFNGGGNMVLSAGCISLNGGDAPDVPKPTNIALQNLPDTKFETGTGWVVNNNSLKTIVSRAPTHQPYPLQSRGINTQTQLQATDTPVEASAEINSKLAQIQNVEFTAIDAENYETSEVSTESVGSLEPQQVTALLAQSEAVAGQDPDVLSENGVGAYSLTPQQLEDAGYIKPGTVEFYLAGDQATSLDVLSSSSVWTGKDGINDVNAFLTDKSLQAGVQTTLYQTSLSELKSIGVVTGSEDPVKLGGLVQAAAKYGAPTVQKWAQGNVSDSSLLANINNLVRGGQYAVSLANQKLSDAIKGFSTSPVGSTSTVNRTAVDNAVANVIGNEKVTTPSYGTPYTIYSNVADENLTYSGDDPIVLANINAERARRGLAPITSA